MSGSLDEARVLAAIDGRTRATVEEIRTAIRQPSVSQTGEGVQAMADWTQAYLAALGGHVRQVPGTRAPFVEGELISGPDRPTLLFYELYDVQPAAGQPGWTVDPFAAEIVEDAAGRARLVGRGAFNSKGPLVGALAAIRAFREAGVELPVNLRFLIEGEEEIGSPSLPGYIERNRNLLSGCDAAFIPYFGTTAKGDTILRLGFKGLTLLEFRVTGGAWGDPSRGDVHALHGAVIGSPTWQLVQALATLADGDERLQVDGLAELAPQPAPEDAALVEEAARHHDLVAYAAEVGTERPLQATAREALWATMFDCTLNIDALVAGKVEDGKEPATVIPRTARAFADLRLLPGMKAEQVLGLIRAHLDRRGFGHVEVICRSSYPASRASINEPVAQALIASMRAHAERLRIFPIHAGAAPMYVFSETLGIPYVFGGVGHGAGSHGPNEYIMVDDVAPFMKSVASFFYRFAETWAAARS